MACVMSPDQSTHIGNLPHLEPIFHEEVRKLQGLSLNLVKTADFIFLVCFVLWTGTQSYWTIYWSVINLCLISWYVLFFELEPNLTDPFTDQLWICVLVSPLLSWLPSSCFYYCYLLLPSCHPGSLWLLILCGEMFSLYGKLIAVR